MEQESAFNELKYRLTIAPVLSYPDFSPDAGLFVLDIDASQHVGIGAVLSQLQPDGTESVIAYGSCSWLLRPKEMIQISAWYLVIC